MSDEEEMMLALLEFGFSEEQAKEIIQKSIEEGLLDPPKHMS